MATVAESKRVILHVPPDAGPADSLALLNTVYNNPSQSFETFKQLCAAAEEMYNAGGRARDATGLVQMAGLLQHPKGEAISLTQAGTAIVSAREDKQLELLHFMLYTGWDGGNPLERGPLWAYRQICDLLWEKEQTAIDGKHLRNELELSAVAYFGGIGADTTGFSLSPKSVNGVIIWLEHLWPPAVEEKDNKKQFQRRSSCSRELLLLAVDWVYRDLLRSDRELANPEELLLDRPRREAICKLCLLNPAALDRLLNGLIAAYPKYLVEGTRAGTYGRFLRMRQRPSLRDDGLMI